MRESVKSVLALVIILCFGGSLFVWMMDGKGANDLESAFQILKYALPIVGILTLAFLLKYHFRKDEVPDFLQSMFGSYFNRGVFCFAFFPIEKGGICFFEMYFQNQFERPCEGTVALRPQRGFFLNRVNMDTIFLQVECGPAAYGVVRVAVPIPEKLQGRKHTFEVGASVTYPKGKGKQLRFRDGISIRSNTNFRNAAHTAMTVAGAMVGTIVVTRPATCTLLLPDDVDSDIPIHSDLEPEIIWKLGDPILEAK